MATKPTRGTTPTPTFDLNLLALSGEIGLDLAVPLVIFMIVGIKLDRHFSTTPLFMLVGVALSLTTSIILIGRMVMRSMRGDK